MSVNEMHSGILSPTGQWWVPADKKEKLWVTIAFAWCMVLFAMMPLWHWKGGQNPSELSFLPIDDPEQQGLHLVYRGDWQAQPGRTGLLTLDQAGKALEWLEKAR